MSFSHGVSSGVKSFDEQTSSKRHTFEGECSYGLNTYVDRTTSADVYPSEGYLGSNYQAPANQRKRKRELTPEEMTVLFAQALVEYCDDPIHPVR